MNTFKKIYLYVFIILCAFFIALSIKNIHNFSSVVTDDNIYHDVPSKLYFANNIYGNKRLGIEDNKEVIKSEEIKKGSLLLKLNNKKFTSVERLYSYLDEIEDDLISIELFKPGINDSILGKRYSYYISKKDIDSNTFNEFRSSVIVSYVLKGGTSDKAGLRVGDLITKVNGNDFESAFEAFNLTLENSNNHNVFFTIYRKGKFSNINVKLTTIKLSFNLLFTYIVGLLLIFLSIFILFNRYKLFQARIVSLSLVLLGLFLVFLPHSTYYYSANILNLKILLNEITFIFFLITLFHSLVYFPFDRKQLIKKIKFITVPYYIGTAYIIYFTFLLFSNFDIDYIVYNQISFAFTLLIYYITFFALNIDRKNNKRIYGKAIKWSFLINLILMVYNLFMVQIFEFPEFEKYYLFLILIPLTYIYTISKYNLFDSLLKFRKNIQYYIISILINVSLLSTLIYLIYLISLLNIELPNLHFTGNSIEVLDKPLKENLQSTYMKIIFLALSLFSFILLHKIREKIFKYLNNKFYISNFDYQDFSQRIIEDLQNQTNLDELSQLVLNKLSEYIKLTHCGIIIYDKERKVISQLYNNFNDNSFKEYIFSIEKKLSKQTEEFKEYFSVKELEPEIQEIFRSCNFNIILPLRGKRDFIGILLLGEKLSESTINQNDLMFSKVIAKQSSIVFDNYLLYLDIIKDESIKKELNIARDIQTESLPSELPTITDLDISGISIPALEVGGDYYDIFIDKTNPKKLTAIIGDVSGKGISAAIYMSKIQGVLKTLRDFNIEIKDFMIKVNDLICEFLKAGYFITSFCVRFELDKNKIQLVRTGHLPLYYYNSQTKKVEKITPNGLALGLKSGDIFNRKLEVKEINYNKNDIFVLITDGITEARNSADIEYEDEKLIKLIESNCNLSSKSLKDKILDDINSFTGRTNQFDDITILIIKVV